ncbi:MAG TPA: ribulose 1,5-bisphosphate carboxylase [bacterium]|nr:ribulose 1,5-bisphosphate carboxylase [bacterium]
MQKAYLNLGTKEVFNGQYLLAVFKVKTYGGLSLEDAASEIAAESSNGSNLTVGTATKFSNSMGAVVYKIDEKKGLAWIAYPWRIFDRGGNVQSIITYVNGNILGMGSLAGCKLIDIWFPHEMLALYTEPSYTIDDMRKYLKVFKRPILGTIVKPKIGLKPSEYADVCYNFWAGGGDFVKNDEPQADQDFAPFVEMVDSVRAAMDKAENETGDTKVHSFNVSAADFDTMIERAEHVKKVMKPESYAYLVDGITAGWSAVQTIRHRYPDVFLHFHRAGHGAFTREENPFGMSVPVLTKLARLAGVSGIHTGTAGIGKMSGSPEEDILATNMALDIHEDGSFFEQSWGITDPENTGLKEAIERDKELEAGDYRKLINAHDAELQKDIAKGERNKTDFFEQEWKSFGKTCPIVSGGMNPVLLRPFIETMGDTDFIITMGGGVHSHPDGTKAGATALVQAAEAWEKDIELGEYAKDHPELATAIEFYNKHGTQAHRIKK